MPGATPPAGSVLQLIRPALDIVQTRHRARRVLLRVRDTVEPGLSEIR